MVNINIEEAFGATSLTKDGFLSALQTAITGSRPNYADMADGTNPFSPTGVLQSALPELVRRYDEMSDLAELQEAVIDFLDPLNEEASDVYEAVISIVRFFSILDPTLLEQQHSNETRDFNIPVVCGNVVGTIQASFYCYWYQDALRSVTLSIPTYGSNDNELSYRTFAFATSELTTSPYSDPAIIVPTDDPAVFGEFCSNPGEFIRYGTDRMWDSSQQAELLATVGSAIGSLSFDASPSETLAVIDAATASISEGLYDGARQFLERIRNAASNGGQGLRSFIQNLLVSENDWAMSTADLPSGVDFTEGWRTPFIYRDANMIGSYTIQAIGTVASFIPYVGFGLKTTLDIAAQGVKSLGNDILSLPVSRCDNPNGMIDHVVSTVSGDTASGTNPWATRARLATAALADFSGESALAAAHGRSYSISLAASPSTGRQQYMGQVRPNVLRPILPVYDIATPAAIELSLGGFSSEIHYVYVPFGVVDDMNGNKRFVINGLCAREAGGSPSGAVAGVSSMKDWATHVTQLMSTTVDNGASPDEVRLRFLLRSRVSGGVTSAVDASFADLADYDSGTLDSGSVYAWLYERIVTGRYSGMVHNNSLFDTEAIPFAVDDVNTDQIFRRSLIDGLLRTGVLSSVLTPTIFGVSSAVELVTDNSELNVEAFKETLRWEDKSTDHCERLNAVLVQGAYTGLVSYPSSTDYPEIWIPSGDRSALDDTPKWTDILGQEPWTSIFIRALVPDSPHVPGSGSSRTLWENMLFLENLRTNASDLDIARFVGPFASAITAFRSSVLPHVGCIVHPISGISDFQGDIIPPEESLGSVVFNSLLVVAAAAATAAVCATVRKAKWSYRARRIRRLESRISNAQLRADAGEIGAAAKVAALTSKLQRRRFAAGLVTGYVPSSTLVASTAHVLPNLNRLASEGLDSTSAVNGAITEATSRIDDEFNGLIELISG